MEAFTRISGNPIVAHVVNESFPSLGYAYLGGEQRLHCAHGQRAGFSEKDHDATSGNRRSHFRHWVSSGTQCLTSSFCTHIS